MAAPRVKPLATGAKSLGALASKITKAAFAAHGSPVATLISHWSEIAGADLAAFTRPERLSWPVGNASSGQGPRGATLHLAAEGPRALEVQHAAPQLIDRLNGQFGYRAVTQIRIIQAPASQKRTETSPSPRGNHNAAEENQPADESEIGTYIEDKRLRQALAQLARRIR